MLRMNPVKTISGLVYLSYDNFWEFYYKLLKNKELNYFFGITKLIRSLSYIKSVKNTSFNFLLATISMYIN